MVRYIFVCLFPFNVVKQKFVWGLKSALGLMQAISGKVKTKYQTYLTKNFADDLLNPAVHVEGKVGIVFGWFLSHIC